ncbi:AraC-type DNA-binding protein [Microbacterium azadirachtae]|uniref:AraC-type DNA-binding protein n=1 Tax=Microbacterium azadirachtae TaxID=582680 RepID=A0A1I6J395_9MICO|nr:helix-turn-helix domain-containing protein [Microbacterium azadirachtae]SFR73492.1 AraC-type DNA-binding protein [Microbacterium azadirachtae]
MPFDTRTFFGAEPRELGSGSLSRDFGMLRVRPGFDRSAVKVRVVIMPRVAIVDMTSGQLDAVVGRGTLRSAYPRAICIVLNGSMTYANANGKVRARPGEVLVLGDTDDDDNPAMYGFSGGFRGLLVLATGHFADSVEDGEAIRPPFASSLGDAFIAFLQSLVQMASNQTGVPSPATVKAAEDITSYIFSALTFDQQSTRAVSTHKSSDPFEQARAIIKSKAHLPALDPAMVAMQMSISVGHLHRIFAQRNGSVANEIRHQRTRLALEVLHDTRLQAVSIEAIARSVGFNSSRTLRRAVLAATGLTPTQIRKKHRRPEGRKSSPDLRR